MARPLVLASSSRYRAHLMATTGWEFDVVAPDFDERDLDHRLGELDAGELAVALATGKARSVAPTPSGALIVAADQLAVLDLDGNDVLLHQAGTAERAVAQLMRMAGRAHELVNGVVVLDPIDGSLRTGIDRHRIVMRDFCRAEAEAYVDAFAPLDCVGSYRIEDEADLVHSIEGGDRSGIIGLPIPLLSELLGR